MQAHSPDIAIYVFQQSLKQMKSLDLCRTAISTHLQIDPSHVQFETSVAGKPKLIPSSTFSPIEFNLSHSRDLTVIAIQMEGSVGIDLEYPKCIQKAADRLQLFFHPSEYEHYQTLQTDKDRQYYFTRLWTLKEAILKCSGEGLLFPLNQFSVSLDSAGTLNIKGHLPTHFQHGCFHLQHFVLFNEVHLSLMYESKEVRKKNLSFFKL